ncbi:T9SS type A sorting domain-containing protein [Membranicola marinus]|uniref:T9SS type A sorting domain-containing protein n=1 Tax=Membranihabitans marinus TaxID=1227546 RepID=A0A953HY64_9BACT|nr:T9SS type A sorting domain-containing protein [Membranihabitans marinus]MBY5957887.1 T9SS type A sorting domain-containing protein [Membranihabitans marinus]
MKCSIKNLCFILLCVSLQAISKAQEVNINIVMTPATIKVGEVGHLSVQICNFGNPEIHIPAERLNPQVSVPAVSTEIVGLDSESTAMWSIISNDGVDILLKNIGSIPSGECNEVIILIKGATEQDSRTISSTLFFDGPPLENDKIENNNSTTSVAVSGILPIELLSFSASAHQDMVDLDWETATELNNSHFEVQRSADGRNYTTIGEVKGAGTSSQVIGYAFTDEQPGSGKNYYRLKQVDYNGSFDYSLVRLVTLGADSRLNVFPNPVAPGSEITIQGQKISTVQLYNMLGQIVVDKVYGQPQSSITISSGNLAQGIYSVQVNGVNEKRVVVK